VGREALNEAALPHALSRYVAEEGGVHVQLERASTAGSRLISLGALPADVASNREPGTILLETARESVEIAPVQRPLGALSWGCDKNGIFVQSPPFGRWDTRWSGEALRARLHSDGEEKRRPWVLEGKTDGKLSFTASWAPRVFISYSRDSVRHKQRVLDLAKRLVADGIDTYLDRPTLQGHSVERNFVEADYVLMVCTERYLRLAGKGGGSCPPEWCRSGG
jgi:hypothetical protein